MLIFNLLRNLHLDRYYKNYDASLVENIKDIYEGKRCFLLGTGPSINNTNHSCLKNEIIFGTNTIYKDNFFPEFSYYCVSDKNVWKEHKLQIMRERTQLILSGHAGRDYLKNKEEYKNRIYKEPIVLKDLGCIRRNGWKDKDLTHGTYWGNSIMIDCALPVAYWMGFSEVYLLGCDCNYRNIHHFDGEKYTFQKDTKSYYDKHWEKVFDSHILIKQDFEKDNRIIKNATPKSSLLVYDKVKLEEII